MPSVFFQTFGCQMNVADSNSIADIFIENGYFVADTAESADIIIINTCSVRENAESKAK